MVMMIMIMMMIIMMIIIIIMVNMLMKTNIAITGTIFKLGGPDFVWYKI